MLARVAHGQGSLPPPAAAGFEHVVVVMMENRSFDHFFGWLPGANGQQAGLTYKTSAAVSHQTHALAPDYQGCAFLDPGHSYSDGRVQYHGGVCDGWLFDGSDSNPPTAPNQANDIYAIGYYGQSISRFWALLVWRSLFATIISAASWPRQI